MILTLETFSTAIGPLVVACRQDTVHALAFADGWEQLAARLQRRNPEIEFKGSKQRSAARELLESYFAGDLAALNRVTADGLGTPFQQSVWQHLREIPVGSTITYAELASRLKKPGAARAVGTANGANPISIVVPCHRVVAAAGGLGGYAYGLERKRWLLAHEGAQLV